ncbi:hypothetical protein GE061_012183 [Apolygus lucorum]|uniref:Uncharacterized protein n=1 Tax=Apolygus lucorum TaxID=248454 RepID=A0A6A4IMS4_APOLU|nr:hypothetical protein GE061_012183 [Apolygus lucorum]
MIWILLFTVIWATVQGQQGVPPVGSEYNDKSPDGSYRFGFQTGDAGNHYHSAVATKDNSVIGRFGSRDPAKGQVVETQYTSGKRGYRPRGPNVARKYDLSQNKIPYNPPTNPNSPNYNPTLEGYHDPNEDPSYAFDFKTPTYTKNEAADSRGHVNGLYSFVDDAGERHDVSYEAGAKIGFNVKTPFPDSKVFSGTFYRGPPSKAGSKTVRGKTSIQQRNDGSYRFVSAGPDQRRTEVSDASGNRRGSYTYLDDKGQQRTVEYIAGPNIGYRIVSKGLGVKFPTAAPFIPPSLGGDKNGVSSTPSTLPGESGGSGSGSPGSGGEDNDDGFGDGLFGPGGSGNSGSGGGGNSGSSGGGGSDFGGGFGSDSKPGGFGGGSGNQGGFGGGSGSGNQGGFGGSGGNQGGFDAGNQGGFGSGSGNQGGFGSGSGGFGGSQGGGFDSGFGGDQGNQGGNQGGFGGGQGNQGGSQGGFGSGSGGSGGFGNTQGFGGGGQGGFGGGSGGFGGSNDVGNDFGSTSERPGSTSTSGFLDGFGFTSSTGSTTTSRPTTSRYPSRPSPSGGFSSSTPGPFNGYPDGRPPYGSPTLTSSRPGYVPPTSSPPFGSNPLNSAFPEDDPSRPPRPLRPSLEDDFLQNSFKDLPKKYFNHPTYFKPKPRPGQRNDLPDRDDSTFLSSDKRFYSFPTGIAVRAHVQSLDILPFGSRIPPPGFALEHSLTHRSG